jgi:hypothetical protein
LVEGAAAADKKSPSHYAAGATRRLRVKRTAGTQPRGKTIRIVALVQYRAIGGLFSFHGDLLDEINDATPKLKAT